MYIKKYIYIFDLIGHVIRHKRRRSTYVGFFLFSYYFLLLEHRIIPSWKFCPKPLHANPYSLLTTKDATLAPLWVAALHGLLTPSGHPLQAYFMAQKQQDEVKANPFTQQQYGNNTFNPQVENCVSLSGLVENLSTISWLVTLQGHDLIEIVRCPTIYHLSNCCVHKSTRG